MKKYILFLLTLCIQYSFAQKGFSPCFQFVGKDSIRIHLDRYEKPVTQDCAYYYRLAKVNPENLNIEGYFEDYYMDNSSAVKATLRNNLLHGRAVVYHETGNKMMEGSYDNGKKVGIWKHWYENGTPYVTYNYQNDVVKILKHFDKKGKIKVENGNGKFISAKHQGHSRIRGKVKNGLPDGTWTISDKLNNVLIFRERFENGTFIEGKSFPAYRSKEEYNEDPKIKLDGDIEIIRTVDIKNCDSCLDSAIQYKNIEFTSRLDDNNFYNYLGKTYTTDNKKGYALCSFVISKKGVIQYVTIETSSSVIDNDVTDIRDLIVNSGRWTPRIQETVLPKSKLIGISRKTVNNPIPTVINFIIHYTDKGYLFYPEAVKK